ncbi:MAG: tyrosine-type recombinase/integrase [Planctomycetota bacterium]
MDLQAALQAFLLQLQADGRSPHTIGQYRRHGLALATWLAATGAGTSVADLAPDLVARFFAADAARRSCHGGPKKAVSLNAMRTSIRCFCLHLHDAGLVAANPARLLRRARCAPPPPRALRDDEQKQLLAVLAAADGPEARRDEMLVRVLLGCGIRIGSALALDVEDVDFAHGELTLRSTKGDRPMMAALPRDVAKRLRRFVGDREDGPVFLAAERRISTRHMQRRLATWLAQAGITGKSAHSLRHSFATRIYSKTGDLQLTQMALGHASITSTTVYARADRSRLTAAIEE